MSGTNHDVRGSERCGMLRVVIQSKLWLRVVGGLCVLGGLVILAHWEWQESTVRLGDKCYVEITLLAEEAKAARPGHSGSTINAIAFSQDGTHLAAGGGRWNPWPSQYEGECRVWNIRRKELISMPRSFEKSVQTLAYSPSGDVLAIGLGDYSSFSRVDVLSVASGKLREQYDIRPGSVRGLTFSADGRYLLCCSSEFNSPGVERGWTNGSVQIIDRTTNQRHQIYQTTHSACKSVALSNDGSLVVAGGEEGLMGGKGQGLIWTWSFPVVNEMRVLSGHSRTVECLALSIDSELLVSGDMDGTVKIWALSNRRCLWTFKPKPGRNCRVLSVSMSSDNRTLAVAVGSWNRGDQWGELQVWDTQSKRHVGTLMRHMRPITSVAFARNGKTLAAATGDGQIKTWNIGGS